MITITGRFRLIREHHLYAFFLRDPDTLSNFLDRNVAFCACNFAPKMEELMSLARRFTNIGHVMFRRDFASCIAINYACIYT